MNAIAALAFDGAKIMVRETLHGIAKAVEGEKQALLSIANQHGPGALVDAVVAMLAEAAESSSGVPLPGTHGTA